VAAHEPPALRRLRHNAPTVAATPARDTVKGGEGEASARAPRRPSRVARQGSRGL